MAEPPESPRRLRCHPVALAEIDGRAIIKRGGTEVRIDGDGAIEALQRIISCTSEDGVPREQVIGSFAEPDRENAGLLIDELLKRRLLYHVDEGPVPIAQNEAPIDVYYWNFGFRADDIAEKAQDLSLVIIGVNLISMRLGTVFLEGACPFQIVDFPLLRNYRFFDDESRLDDSRWPSELLPLASYDEWSGNFVPEERTCIIATSDFGGLHAMREWNEYCVAHGCFFFPIVLQNMLGFVGPLIVPGETACYECLRARQNSHIEDAEVARAPERMAFDSQGVVGYHPAMSSILGDIGALEIVKFFLGPIPVWNVGTLLEVDLIRPGIERRKVLIVPRCRVCSGLVAASETSVKHRVFVPQGFTEQR